MYHLLVKSSEWSPKQDSLAAERVLKFTEASIANQFRPNGMFNMQQVAYYPALFVTEVGGQGAQLGRIGWIQNVSSAGGHIVLNYVFDERFEPVSNRVLQSLGTSLGTDPFAWIHTHWAIKNVDLYAELLRAKLQPLVAPKVFSLSAEVDERLLAVMMPFDAAFDGVYETIKAVAAQIRFSCHRADDIWRHDAIIQDIVSLISKARVVICDCSARNPNVFYEAGIAHTLGKDVILVAQSESDVPFNLRHLRFIPYLNNTEGRATLGSRLSERIATLTKP